MQYPGRLVLIHKPSGNVKFYTIGKNGPMLLHRPVRFEDLWALVLPGDPLWRQMRRWWGFSDKWRDVLYALRCHCLEELCARLNRGEPLAVEHWRGGVFGETDNMISFRWEVTCCLFRDESGVWHIEDEQSLLEADEREAREYTEA